MKLLLFSDLHASSAAAKIIVEQAQSVDVLIGAGDFANVRRNLHVCIDILKAVDRPTILVSGNNESTDELRDACRGWSLAHILHGTGITIDGIGFYGLGGGVPVTPFGAWSYDFSEDEASKLLADCPRGCVLVTHSPPKGAVDRSSSGLSLGSTAVRATIERVAPVLVVCGHIHESGGQQAMIGLMPIVNAGPRAIEWQLDQPTN